MTTTPPLDEIQVLHRTGQWCPGRRIGEVVAYDVRILPEYQVPGRPAIDRSYLLLDQGIQLTRPVVFEAPVEGWWYVDLVEIESTEAATVLINSQRFIERHLRGSEKGSVDPPQQFPPASIAELQNLPCLLE